MKYYISWSSEEAGGGEAGEGYDEGDGNSQRMDWDRGVQILEAKKEGVRSRGNVRSGEN